MKTGSILIYVLWSLSFVSFILMLITGGLYFYRGTLARTSENYMQSLEMLAVAKASLAEVRNRVFLSKNPQGVVYAKKEFRYQNRLYSVVVEPEDAKLSINAANAQSMERLLTLLGTEQGRARDISQRLVTERKQRVFLSLLELKAYMSQEEYTRAKEKMTIVPTLVNVNYASPLVLQAVGFSRDEADHIVSLRERLEHFSKQTLKPIFPGKEVIIETALYSSVLPQYFRISVMLDKGPFSHGIFCIFEKTGYIVDCGRNDE
ncbi:MAG: hypothetical protein ACK4SM_05375 [Aquificaceae bacterium]